MTSTQQLFSEELDAGDDEENLSESNYLNRGQEDEMEIYGYKRNVMKSIILWTGTIISLGLLSVVFHWSPKWKLYASHTLCPLKYATNLLIVENYRNYKTYSVKRIYRLNLAQLNLEDMKKVCSNFDVRNAQTFDPILLKSVKIYLDDGSYLEETVIRRINVKKLWYVWCHKKGTFIKIAGLEKAHNKVQLQAFTGYSYHEQIIRRIIYGRNEIIIKVQGFIELIILELLNPFYVFQIFTLIVWYLLEYIYYAVAIIAVSTFGILSAVIQTRQNQKRLQDTVSSAGIVTVCRNYGESKDETIYEEIPSSHLVPGDIIVIPREGFIVPCDAILLSGTCIVNESMLTGESVPVSKTALPCHEGMYNDQIDCNHTLYCGTHVLQARFYHNENVFAIVFRTSFLTIKGSLVRSILHPVPHDFKFDQDCYKFVSALACIALVGAVYSAITKIVHKMDLFKSILETLDTVTIVVPPALPAAMTVGKFNAMNRLQKQNVYCINPSVINVSGSIDCICFDKTGTLTEDGMDLRGILISEGNKLRDSLITDVKLLDDDSSVKRAMACCHSLTVIHDVLSGDSLDIKMFQATGWIFEEPQVTDSIKYDLLIPTVVKSSSSKNQVEIALIHQFQFSSSLQRMSMITKHLDTSDFTVYCKGSPEMIKSLCIAETVPDNLDFILNKYAQRGFRVIAMGQKTMVNIDTFKLRKLHRQTVEYDLSFIGLLIFENKLKPQTTPVIKQLRDANLKVVMITGDNIHTAMCVAKECGIINNQENIVHLNFESLAYELSLEINGCRSINAINNLRNERIYDGNEHGTINTTKYALTGNTWQEIRDKYPSIIPKLLSNGVVFARMSPDQKQQVIESMQLTGRYVAMCGDGANDCGALKNAHVGISLSDSEASVASPFTYREQDITCVPIVIKEGRAALVTSFGIFKYIILYSLFEYFTVMLLEYIGSNLSDFEYMYVDLFIVGIPAFLFGRTEAYKGPLSSEPPTSSLISFIPLLSITFHLILAVTFQAVAFFLPRYFPWYLPFYNLTSDNFANYENYSLFMMSLYQYIIIVVIFSRGKPYREPIYKNIWFFLSIVFFASITSIITVIPDSFVRKLFEFRYPPDINFRFTILSLGIVNFIISFIFEDFIFNYVLHKWIRCKTNTDYFNKDNNCQNVNVKNISGSIAHLSEKDVKRYGAIDKLF